MEKQPTIAMRILLAIGAIITWSAVVVQLYLFIVNRATPISEVIIRFFSYFTILSNILVALCFTILLLKQESGCGRFFSEPKNLTAITTYIGVVGIVYNIVLRSLWAPEGLQMVVDESLHLVIPVLVVLFWFQFVPKTELKWKNVFPWLIYPFVYMLFILFRGALSGFYPYPFIDVNQLGYYKVLLNTGGLFIAFLLLSLLFVSIGKIITWISKS